MILARKYNKILSSCDHLNLNYALVNIPNDFFRASLARFQEAQGWQSIMFEQKRFVVLCVVVEIPSRVTFKIKKIAISEACAIQFFQVNPNAFFSRLHFGPHLDNVRKFELLCLLMLHKQGPPRHMCLEFRLFSRLSDIYRLIETHQLSVRHLLKERFCNLVENNFNRKGKTHLIRNKRCIFQFTI